MRTDGKKESDNVEVRNIDEALTTATTSKAAT